MFIEYVNKTATFYDGDKVYNYSDLIDHVKCAQFKIKALLPEPSIIGISSYSSFLEVTTVLAFLELGHKILFIPKKHIFYQDIYNDFFDVLDLIVDFMDSDINSRNVPVITQDDLYDVGEYDELVLEMDDLKTGFVFLSSGTTGKPKIIEQSHRRLLHAAHQTMERIWVDNKNFLLHRGNTINHLGIFTTTYLPALFMGGNVSWFYHHGDELQVENSDKRPIYNSLLMFPWQPVEMLSRIPISNNVKVITGGSTLTEEFILEIFSNSNIESIYNVYGATEVITPLMWNRIKKDTPNRLFTEILEGITVNVNSKEEVHSMEGFVDTSDSLPIPDTLKAVKGAGYGFISRKSSNLYRDLKYKAPTPLSRQLNNVSLTEDQFIGLISKHLGNFETPLPIVVMTPTAHPKHFDHYLVFDSKKHEIIDKTTLEGINKIVYLYFEVDSTQLDTPFINKLIPIDNLSNFNNGLKLDRGLIRKAISNEINNKHTNLI